MTGPTPGPVTGQPGPSYAAAVWSWEQHLRSGGRRPWRDWRTTADPGTPPDGWSAPGAAQLELVRRAAASSHRLGSTDLLAALADLVLSRSGPGRGRAEQPLAWSGGDVPGPRRFGAPAIDPADVPTVELVRLAVGLLTEVLLDPGAVGSTERRREPRRRLLTREPAFVLVGAPVTTCVVRRDLAAAGHLEGGRAPCVVLLAEPFDESLAQAWSARVQRGAPVRWRGFLQRWSGRDQLPPSADLGAIARDWAGRVGPQRVHVVTAAGDPSAATTTTAMLLGLGPRPARKRTVPRAPALDLAAEQVDAMRRVNAVLKVRTRGEEHEAAVGRLRALLAQTPGVDRVTLPEVFRHWAAARAQRLADDLTSGGYAVHGRLEDLAPRFDQDRPTHPRTDRVLDVLLAACVDAISHRRPSEGGRPR